jgi:hypothetical protein
MAASKNTSEIVAIARPAQGRLATISVCAAPPAGDPRSLFAGPTRSG